MPLGGAGRRCAQPAPRRRRRVARPARVRSSSPRTRRRAPTRPPPIDASARRLDAPPGPARVRPMTRWPAVRGGPPTDVLRPASPVPRPPSAADLHCLNSVRSRPPARAHRPRRAAPPPLSMSPRHHKTSGARALPRAAAIAHPLSPALRPIASHCVVSCRVLPPCPLFARDRLPAPFHILSQHAGCWPRLPPLALLGLSRMKGRHTYCCRRSSIIGDAHRHPQRECGPRGAPEPSCCRSGHKSNSVVVHAGTAVSRVGWASYSSRIIRPAEAVLPGEPTFPGAQLLGSSPHGGTAGSWPRRPATLHG